MRFRESSSAVPARGADGVLSYAGRKLLVPSTHDVCTNVVAAVSDGPLTEVIERCLTDFPHIRSTLFSRPVGSYRSASQSHCRLQSVAETENAKVRLDLVTLALEIRAQLPCGDP